MFHLAGCCRKGTKAVGPPSRGAPHTLAWKQPPSPTRGDVWGARRCRSPAKCNRPQPGEGELARRGPAGQLRALLDPAGQTAAEGAEEPCSGGGPCLRQWDLGRAPPPHTAHLLPRPPHLRPPPPLQPRSPARAGLGPPLPARRVAWREPQSAALPLLRPAPAGGLQLPADPAKAAPAQPLLLEQKKTPTSRGAVLGHTETARGKPAPCGRRGPSPRQPRRGRGKTPSCQRHSAAPGLSPQPRSASSPPASRTGLPAPGGG